MSFDTTDTSWQFHHNVQPDNHHLQLVRETRYTTVLDKRQTAIVGAPVGEIPVEVTLTPRPGVTQISTSLIPFVPPPATSTIVVPITLGSGLTSSQIFIRTGLDGPFSYRPVASSPASSLSSSTTPTTQPTESSPGPSSQATTTTPTTPTSLPSASPKASTIIVTVILSSTTETTMSTPPFASPESSLTVMTITTTEPAPATSSPSRHAGLNGNIAWIAGPIVGGLVVLVSVGILLMLLRRRRNRHRLGLNGSKEPSSVEDSPRSELSAGFGANRHEMANAHRASELCGSTPRF